jgi:hypothetical protein
MKKSIFIAVTIFLMLVSIAWGSNLINVTSEGKDGDLVFYDVSKNEIFSIEAANRLMTFPSGSGIDIESGASLKLAGTAITATAAKINMLPADGNAGEFLTTNGAGTWSWAAGTSGSLDDAYNTGRAITTDAGPVALSNTDTDNAFQLTINATPSGPAAAGGAQITVGANSTQDALEFVNTGSGNDIYGTGGTWTVTKAGAATFASLALTSGVTISGGAVSLNNDSNFATNINTGTSNGAVTIGGGTGTVAVNSSVWDIATTGAASGFTTISMTDDLSLANGKAVKGSTTTAETIAIQTYDNDHTTYRSSILLTNGDTPAVLIGTNNETVAVNSADWDISTTGDMTGIGAVTMNGLLTGTLGATVTGAVVNLNASSNFAVNIASGTSTGTVTVGGAAAQTINIGDGAAAKTVTLGSSNTTSTTTISAGSGNINLVGALATGDAITGDGTAALGGFLKTVTNDVDAHSVLVTESGTVLTNAGAGDAYAHTLPAAAIGLNYCFIVMAAQELRVTPAAGDAINIAGTAGAAAEYWTASAVGEALCIVATDVNTWVATSYTGTWTQQNP